MKIAFLIFPQVNLLDLGGMSQLFLEAKMAGVKLDIEYYSTQKSIESSANIALAEMKMFDKAELKKGDFLIIPSIFYQYVLSENFAIPDAVAKLICKMHKEKVTICSLCNAAFILAKIDLLKNIKCTTHWLRIDELKMRAKNAIVVKNLLYVEDNNIITGAGGSSCFDVGIYIVNKIAGGRIAHRISEHLVLYNFRKGNEEQISIYLRYRNHSHNAIHNVQDYIINHLNSQLYLYELAEIANMSERNFTRIFKHETGLTVKQFINDLRVEKARQIMESPDISQQQVANFCGLKSDRQLRRILQKVEMD